MNANTESASAAAPSHANPEFASRTAGIINAYVAWAETRWVLSKHAGVSTQLASEIVMTFGLAGETGEVADVVDVFLDTGVRDEVNLRKELGDALYYWARLVKTYTFEGGAMFVRAAPSEEGSVGAGQVDSQLRKLTRAQGVIAEVVKKFIRDGNFDAEKMSNGLFAYAGAWRGLCEALGLDWQDVLQQNRDKIEGRNARGTMRGSGNDR